MPVIRYKSSDMIAAGDPLIIIDRNEIRPFSEVDPPKLISLDLIPVTVSASEAVIRISCENLDVVHLLSLLANDVKGFEFED